MRRYCSNLDAAAQRAHCLRANEPPHPPLSLSIYLFPPSHSLPLSLSPSLTPSFLPAPPPSPFHPRSSSVPRSLFSQITPIPSFHTVQKLLIGHGIATHLPDRASMPSFPHSSLSSQPSSLFSWLSLASLLIHPFAPPSLSSPLPPSLRIRTSFPPSLPPFLPVSLTVCQPSRPLSRSRVALFHLLKLSNIQPKIRRNPSFLFESSSLASIYERSLSISCIS